MHQSTEESGSWLLLIRGPQQGLRGDPWAKEEVASWSEAADHKCR